MNSANSRTGRVLFLLAVLGFVGCSKVRPHVEIPLTLSQNHQSPAIVLGFVGFVDHPDDPRLSIVQLGERLRDSYPSGVYVETFQNRGKDAARKTIWLLL